MNGASGFAANHFDDARVRVAERVDGDAAEEVEIFLAGGVIDIAAAAMGEQHRRALVGRQKKLFGVGQTGIELRFAHEARLRLACRARHALSF